MVSLKSRMRALLLGTICATISLPAIVSIAPVESKEPAQAIAVKESAVISKLNVPSGRHRMVAKILIHASPEIVWNTVHEERQKDPDIAYAKIISHEKNEMLLEEKFILLPVIGTAVCVMKDIEVPNERIDYQLVESDRFKAMEGSWVLTAHDGGKATILELQSYLDLGLPVPRMMLEGITGQKLQKRVTNIKVIAEKVEASRIANAKPPGT